MMLGRYCASALFVALAAAHPAAIVEDRDCGSGKCVVVESVVTPLPHLVHPVKPETYLQAVVWVNKAGEPVCTVTETITATVTATAYPSPPPPPPAAKVVVHKEKEDTTTTIITTESTTTIVVKPVAPTAPPKEHVVVPTPPAPEVVHVNEATGCNGDCGKFAEKTSVTVIEEIGGCEGDCSEGPQPQPKPAPKPSPKPVPMPAPKPEGGSVPSSSMNIKSQHGISYAAYRGDHSCKSKEDIDDDFDQMKGLYSVVRTYGVDCNQVEYIYEAAKRIGSKVFFGIWDLSAVEEEAKQIIAGVNGDWSIVDSISVGNELVNNGEASAEQVVVAVKQARSVLRGAGYEGPVVAVDTFIATEANPQLCDESDYCAINAHAYFDSTISADQAGEWLVKTVKSVKSKLSSEKRIIITETGWPTEGSANGLAIPGIDNQKMALESISKAFADNPGDIILFSAFNDLWKGDRDKYWGIGGAVSRCDR